MTAGSCFHDNQCQSMLIVTDVMAFSPRSMTTFGLPTKNKLPTGMILDLHSFARQAPCEERDKPPNTAQHRLWLDITRLDTTNLLHIDEQYNSNMWKNFKFVRSKHSASDRDQSQPRASTEMIASIFPLQVPKPSSIGKNTYYKFLQETSLPEQKQKTVIWQEQGRQQLESRKLKIQSECRAPPIDWEGRILPPANFKKYPRAMNMSEEWDFIPLSSSSHALYASPSSSPYSRLGTPWHYGLHVRRPHIW